MDERRDISPSLCLPPSKGAITADTESTITAFTEPPPTDACYKNVTKLDCWKFHASASRAPQAQPDCLLNLKHRNNKKHMSAKQTCWSLPVRRLYRQSSNEKTSNKRKIWILWRASICKMTGLFHTVQYETSFYVYLKCDSSQLTCSSLLLVSASSIWSKRRAVSPPVVSINITLCFRW